MRHKTQLEKNLDFVADVMRHAGYDVEDPDDHFRGVTELYSKPSMRDVLEEELPFLLKDDLFFFYNNGIALPDDLEGELRGLYLDVHGKDGANQAVYSAKMWLRQMRFFLVDNPDEEKLRGAIDEFRIVLEGRYYEKRPLANVQ